MLDIGLTSPTAEAVLEDVMARTVYYAAAQFAEAGLLDEVLVSIAPVTLGAGRPLFPRRFDLELTSLARNRSFACASYAVVGARSDEFRRLAPHFGSDFPPEYLAGR